MTGSSTDIPNEESHLHRRSSIKNKDDEHRSRPKRKSNVFLAAEAVQQERDVIKALKRLSMGGSLSLDPDLPAEYEFQDYQKKQQQRKRSTSTGSLSSTSSQDDDNDNTLIGDLSLEDDVEEDARLDTEKLLWVPAKAHPSIAPDQFKRHVQSTLDDISKRLHAKTRQPIPSLKELTDELDKLTEMAGLAATDAVSLARSLSSASSSSLMFGDSSVSHSSPSTSQIPDDDLEQHFVDQDAPMFADSSNSLKRNKWTTYSRRRKPRLDKDKTSTSLLLSNDDEQHKLPTPPEKEPPQFPQQGQEQKPAHRPPLESQRVYYHTHQDTLHDQRQPVQVHQPQQSESPQHYSSRQITRSVSSDHHREKGSNLLHHDQQLQRSQSEMTSTTKKTNHSRNRHAGSVIDLNDSPSSQNQDRQIDDVPTATTPMVLPKPTTTNTPPRRVSPLSHQLSTTPQPQARPQPHRPQPIHVPVQLERPQPGTTLDESEALTPLGSPKDGKRESKSKDFLNLFKKKRSPSPKATKDQRQRVITPTRTTFNDENSPPVEPNQISPQKTQRISPQKLRSTSFGFMKKDGDRPKLGKLQDSVKVIPKQQQPLHQKQQHDHHQHEQAYPLQNQQPFTNGSNSGASNSVNAHQDLSSQEQHRAQKESLTKRISETSPQRSTKPNAPLQFTDSAFGFPLPPLSHSTIIMLDHRFPVHVERALYRLSHLKLANPRRPLRQQVLLSNFMYAYLNLVNHTLYLQQLDEERAGEDQQPSTSNDAIDVQQQQQQHHHQHQQHRGGMYN